ncbi:MAG: class I SAM-dependent methyltransferase [Alphaproteobacteria bacterium]|nr:class I SAM-dependent methyltransferase [Alphaproteobacteria bacterium]
MRGWIYDGLLVWLTRDWYAAVLDGLAPGTRVLDVGIGTGSALLHHAPLLVARDLHVTGVDIDADYVRRALRRIADAGLEARVQVHHEPLEAHRGGPYDVVYFAGSFMLLDDPVASLRHAVGLLAPGGRLAFTQTFQVRRSAVMERLKPVLRALTTVDFGQVTYEADFARVLAEAGVEVVQERVLSARAGRSARVVWARPQAAVG